MDRDADPPGHAAAAAEVEPEQFDEFGTEAAPLEIRVRRVRLQRWNVSAGDLDHPLPAATAICPCPSR